VQAAAPGTGPCAATPSDPSGRRARPHLRRPRAVVKREPDDHWPRAGLRHVLREGPLHRLVVVDGCLGEGRPWARSARQHHQCGGRWLPHHRAAGAHDASTTRSPGPRPKWPDPRRRQRPRGTGTISSPPTS
jgi:hypothetical protein